MPDCQNPTAMNMPDCQNPTAMNMPDCQNPTAMNMPDCQHPTAMNMPDCQHPTAMNMPDCQHPTAMNMPDCQNPIASNPLHRKKNSNLELFDWAKKPESTHSLNRHSVVVAALNRWSENHHNLQSGIPSKTVECKR